MQNAVVRALAAAACVITAALGGAAAVGSAALPASPQGPLRFPTFEISSTPMTNYVRDADPSAAGAEWFELSYSPTDLSDLLVSEIVSTDLLPAVCGTGPPNASAALFAACSAVNAPTRGNWAFAFKSKEWKGAVDADGWRVNGLLHTVTIAAASDLSTPLDQFNGATTSEVSRQITSALGISNTSVWGQSISGTEAGNATNWGISVRTNFGLEVIGTSAGVQVYQHVTIGSADLFTGVTPLGPLVGAEATFGSLSISASALDLDGQLLAAATITLQMGDLELSYAEGPGGSVIVGTFNHDRFEFGFAVDSSDFGFTLAYDLGDGRTLQASGSGLNGFQIAFVASIGPGSPVTVPLGPGAFSLTPQPGSSTPAFRLRWPFSAAQPILPERLPAAAPPSSPEQETAPQGTDDGHTP